MIPGAGGPPARRIPLWGAAVVVVAACGPARVFPVRVLDAGPVDQAAEDLVLVLDRAGDATLPDAGPPDALAMDLARDLPPFTGCPAPALIGYATLGQVATVGGEGGTTVRVTNAADLITYAGQTGKLIIQISGTITLTDPVRVKPDKTIEGLLPGDGLVGNGLLLKDSQNVIIRRLTISKAIPDAIALDNSRSVWIDHCDLSSSLDATDAYDGLVEITHGSEFVTVSWTKFHDHFYSSLVGHSRNNAAEDTGRLTVSYHHNYFLRTQYYNPRVRFGFVHVFNNLYEYDPMHSGTPIASQESAHVLVEGNVFKSTKKTPIDCKYAAPNENDGTVWIPTPDTNVYIDSPLDQSKLVFEQWALPSGYRYVADTADTAEVLVSHCAGTDYLK